MSKSLELPPSGSDLFTATWGKDAEDRMKNGDAFSNRLKKLLVELAPEDQNKPPPPEEKNEEWKKNVRTLVGDMNGVQNAVRMLEPIIDQQSNQVEQVRQLLVAENDQSQYGAQQTNVLGQTYNAAAPVSNGIWHFLRDVDGTTSQAQKVETFESQEDGDFDENIQEAAAAVTMINQVLTNLKGTILPRMVTVNVTVEGLYNESDRISEIFNGNARRLTNLKERQTMLEAEMAKAKEVMGVLTEFATRHSSDMATENAQAAGAAEGASLLQEHDQGASLYDQGAALLQEHALPALKEVPPNGGAMHVLREWQAKRHPFSTTGLAVTALGETNISKHISEAFAMDIPSLEAPTPFPPLKEVPTLKPLKVTETVAPAPVQEAVNTTEPSGILASVESVAAGLWQEVTSIGPWRRLG